jgi:ribosomal protein S27AE
MTGANWLIFLVTACVMVAAIGWKYWRRRCPDCGAFFPDMLDDSRPSGWESSGGFKQTWEVKYRCGKCEHVWQRRE